MKNSFTVSVLVVFCLLLGMNDPAPVSAGVQKRQISPDVLSRKAVCYSGYRTGESPEASTYPSESEILQDFKLLVKGGWTLIRLFDSGTHAERVLKVIKENNLDIKVLLGVWISGPKKKHDKENRDQIKRAVALASGKDYRDIIVAVSVGNETLDSWSSIRTPVADLVGYIRETRRKVTQPVTTDDQYPPFLMGSDGDFSYADVIKVLQAVDFVAVHCYAFLNAPWGWDDCDWKQESLPVKNGQRARAMMAAAMETTKAYIRALRSALDKNKLDLPIVIGEAGWKSKTIVPTGAKPEGDHEYNWTEQFFAHPVNQKMFYDALMGWSYGKDKAADAPSAVFYFEAFDEPWKGGDDGWGLFDVDRNPKWVVRDLFPGLVPAGAPRYSDNDAVSYDPVK